MKFLLISLLLLLTAMANAQQPAAAQTCQQLLAEGSVALEIGNYEQAFTCFTKVKTCNPAKTAEVDTLIRRAFRQMAEDRRRAVAAEKRADSAIAQAKKIIDALYFYDDKFAIVFNHGKFSVIDKQGNRVERFEYYEKAEPFDPSTGFAQVTVIHHNRSIQCLLDTFGYLYQVAYSPAELTDGMSALDLRNWKSDSFPSQILQYPQLKILLLNGDYQNRRQFGKLPAAFCQKLPHIEVLQLSGCGLDSLPADIGKLTKLIRLDASRNQLTSLPADIGKLTNLTRLNISWNSLITLPTEIGNLTNLIELGLQANKLATLPIEIGKLTNLTVLGLSMNKLTTLPAEMGYLTNLRRLELWSNPTLSWKNLCVIFSCFPQKIIITYERHRYDKYPNVLLIKVWETDCLPAEIGLLTQLIELELEITKCNPPKIPNEIWGLTNLTRLSVSSNHPIVLPAEIGRLTNLTELSLYTDSLTFLPAEIGKLTNLMTLDLRGNNTLSWQSLCMVLSHFPKKLIITSEYKSNNDPNFLLVMVDIKGRLPAEIGLLTQLTGDLDMEKWRLETLPAEIGNLTNLTMLGVGDNDLTSLPTEIGRLTNLTTLSAWGNQLTVIPAEVGNLTKLKTLELFGNNLTTLPAEIGTLTHLTTLHLCSNKLTTLPAEIGKLTELEWLTVCYNPISVFPIEMQKLIKLKLLEISSNQFPPEEIAKLKAWLPNCEIKEVSY